MFNIAFIFSGHDSLYGLDEACQKLNIEFPGDFQFDFIDLFELEANEEYFQEFMEFAEKYDFIYVAIHGGVTFFKKFDLILKKFAGKKKFFIHSGLDEENILLLKKSGLSQKQYSKMLGYYLTGGYKNCRNLLLYTASLFSPVHYEYGEVETLGWEGVYHPLHATEDSKAYISKALEIGKPIIGILFYSRYYHENNIQHIDYLIKSIENYGGTPLAIYTSSAPVEMTGSRGLQWTINNILMRDGKVVVDVIINNMAYAQSVLSNPGDGSTAVENSIFEQLDVPVIQAMSLYGNYSSWKDSIVGLDSMSLASSVYYPEYDGQLISSPICYTDEEEIKGTIKRVFKPIKERVEKISRLALNWASLQKKPNNEKKIAIIFHNMPPRNDMIGCAYGLDSPKSVWNIVETLKNNGVSLEYDFQDGDEIINKIINTVSNDTRWLSPDKVLAKSIGIIESDTYRQWFSNLEPSVREKMIIDWQEPPGEFMVYQDKFPVPGILNGNIFIGLQPARGYGEKADEVYHNTDIVPPHQYIAFYKWVKHIFKADVIIHVGTHGTLEWLPGKEIGLSNACYPDIAIDDIPHLYPYIINVPGEGIQVKRRSFGIIIDHLIPSLVNSGTYDEMSELDDLIKQYYQAKQGDKSKLPTLANNITELAIKNNYDQDLKVDSSSVKENFDIFLDKLHAWIEEIKASLINDGLHILGEAPKEVRLKNIICALLRIGNGSVPSLPEAVCEIMGIDYHLLKDKPELVDDEGISNYMKLNIIEEKARNIIETLQNKGFNPEKTDEIINEYFGNIPEISNISLALKEKLSQVLEFVCSTIKPKLDATVLELASVLQGVEGRFIPPSGSGCPTRGRVSILPTGKNFYSIDPTAVPTRASWEVGKSLGDDLLNRYLIDEGRYPEGIVMVVYAGSTMKTCGDDIAETLYLMGIKPVWLENSDRVVGLEVIPQEQLKRPRIDVTLRITGLFRDTFPNIIELIDDAVKLAASQDESNEDNYVRKNILKELSELKNKGVGQEQAFEQASMRIFGCPPGTYGAGVDILINSKNWTSLEDLGDVYTTWGGHAYGKNVHGTKVKDVFTRRLANADVTVKNEASVEGDMLDSDDFYNYHGGLIAAVRTHSGIMPKAYSTDSSDPARTKIKDVNEETARIMRARILNPKWFEGLVEHGYKGAQEIAAMVDIIFGWDATAEVIEDWMYEKVTENFLLNEERREWIESVNPWAIHNMVERLLEAAQRGMWKAKDESLNELKKLYLSIEGELEGKMD